VMAMEATLARLGTTVVASQALRTFLLAHGFPRAKTVLLPYGVQLLRREPKRRHEPLRVATVATLEPWKGIDVLLEASARASTKLHLDLYGEGPLRSSLESQANRLGVDATFHGMVGDVHERLREADVFVLATRGDNMPVSVLEAMSLALPVISTRTGGLPELVAHGDTGFLVEPDDAEGLAGAIDRVAQDEALRLRLGRGGAERIERRFARDKVARDMVTLYEGLVAAAS
jgi:glycosyltransferase involved in cell wall biosynthesis